MSNLGPQQQNVSYDGLLQIPGGVTAQLQQVQDGEGRGTGLFLSSAGINVTTSDSFVASIDGTQITGAVPRLISDGFGDYLSVKDFGAVGNGSHNDTSAFTTAVNSGQMVFAPKPATQYVINSGTQPKKAAIFLDPSATWEQSTNSGNLNILRGARPNGADGANIWRFTDRVFVGDAAAFLSGNEVPNQGSSWIGDTVNYAGYLGLNGKTVVASTPKYDDIPYMVVAGARTSDTQQAAIGVGVTVVADYGNYSTWGAIYEMQLEVNSQMHGIEIGAKNKTAYNQHMYPNAQTTGVFGLWLAGGGDNAFGGASVNPSTAGIAFVKNSNTWNTGIVFMKDSLTAGEAISMSSEGVGGPHNLVWYNSAGSLAFLIHSANTTSDFWSIRSQDDGVNTLKNGKRILSIGGAASAVNGITIYGQATGLRPSVAASGDDTNIDLQLSPKGTGNVCFGTLTASADAPVTGYITIKDATGTLRKLAVIA